MNCVLKCNYMPYKDPVIRAIKGLERSRKYRKLRPERVKENARKIYKIRRQDMLDKQKKYANGPKREVYLLRKKIKHLEDLYGMTWEEYQKKVLEQNGVCAICKKECSSGKKLSVDHSHKTNKNRGLLCGKCNFGIGIFKDNLELLEEAKKYLIKYA